MTYLVLLTEAERDSVTPVGVERHRRAEGRGQPPDWRDGSEEGNHVLGVRCELAYFKHYGIPWDSYPHIDTYGAADAPGGVQIRGSRSSYFKVKDKDTDEHLVVFVRCRDPEGLRYELVGWLYVGEVKLMGRREDLHDRGRPCYVVRERMLDPIETLAAQIASGRGR